MTPHDIEKLLGGYMTGTLTEAENSALMRAALDDQQLFDALADDEALRDALADPVFRARLRARLAPEAAPPQRSFRWLWMLAPVMAAGLALVFVLNRPEPTTSLELASVKAPAQNPDREASDSRPVPAAPRPTPTKRPTEAPSPESAPSPAPPPPLPPAPPPAPTAASAPPPAPQVAVGRVSEAVTLSAQAPVITAEKKTVAKDEAAPAPTPPPPPPPAAPARVAALGKATAETDALAAAALDLQIERSINGRFESTEVGALRQGDRVRIRVRVPEAGTLVMSAGPDLARSTLAEPGRTYYLPDANGLPPGDAPVEIAIALHSASTFAGERGNLFRARQQATANVPAASALGGAPPAGIARDSRREDSQDAAKAKTASPKEQEAGPKQRAVPPTVRLHLEFKPR